MVFGMFVPFLVNTLVFWLLFVECFLLGGVYNWRVVFVFSVCFFMIWWWLS